MITIASFRIPDEAARDRIRMFLSELPISGSAGNFRLFDCESGDSWRGGVDAILEQLLGRLRGDYAENIVEEQSSPWLFEYVLQFDEDEREQVGVMTRIYSNDQAKGSIYYGHRIRRLGDDDFWICFSG